jgi:peptide/nickel transport system permease protein
VEEVPPQLKDAPVVPRFPRLARFLRDRLALLGLVIVTLFALAALLAPVLAPFDPTAVNPTRRLEPPGFEHLLGLDNLGRDILSRLLYGSRWSLGTAAIATCLIMTIGVAVGAICGYFGGLLDEILMRLVDLLLAFPGLILALAIAGTLGPGIENVMLGLVTVWWAGYARIVRGMVLVVRERQYIEAARALGLSNKRIILRHILPNVLPPVIILATLEMGGLILAISGLSFLGLGVQSPETEWGSMLNDGRAFLLNAPQLMIYPGVAISLVVIGLNLVGDGLRDAFDPHLKVSR